MAKILRVALIGGSELIRATRRAALEANPAVQVILATDGFNLSPDELINYQFDVAVLEMRLPVSPAFEFTRAIQALGKVNSVEVGRVLISAVYEDLGLRRSAIAAGAVDCIFLEQGITRFVESVESCSEVDADFGVRQILESIPEGSVDSTDFQKAAVALDALDEKEAAIIKQFCLLKTDSQIAQSVQVPKLKVKSTITKAQNLLLLSTRSQLLLRLRELGALTL
ncbi:MAG: hypothetical protein ACKOFA_02250 [Rhodoluna sp.]